MPAPQWQELTPKTLLFSSLFPPTKIFNKPVKNFNFCRESVSSQA
jgi:hypothetical protein